MNSAVRIAYEAAGTMLAGVASVGSRARGDAKWLRSLRARRGLLARYAGWGAAGRDRTRPLLWMHAPSVGESLQARPVLEELRRRFPAVQLAYTHYSPSADAQARAFLACGLVDFADYLPWDRARDVERALDALAPSVLVFSKLDVWPVLVARAAARGAKLALISATLRARSARRSWLGTTLLRDAYAALDAVGAINDADADRLSRLGVRPAALHVTGDTRYDQVWARAVNVDRTAAPLATIAAPERRTLLAGSTWPSDEAVVLEGWRALHARHPDLRLILVPHEPTPSHLASVGRWATRHGIRWLTLSDHERMAAGPRWDRSTQGGGADIVVVDRVGVLGTLYAVGDIAFVGGAFHRAGIHSVLEPAAFGLPILFGPRHDASPDARLLLDAGGAAVVRTASDLTDAVGRWLADATLRHEAGRRAREVVHAGLGATGRSVDMVAGLLP